MYLIDFKNYSSATQNSSANTSVYRSYEDDNLTDGQRYRKKHQWWFDNEAPRFAETFARWKYEEYIPEAKECFHFYPRFVVNADGKLQYNMNSCVVSYPSAFYEKKHFYKLSAERQEQEIIQLKWKMLDYEKQIEFIQKVLEEHPLPPVYEPEKDTMFMEYVNAQAPKLRDRIIANKIEMERSKRKSHDYAKLYYESLKNN